MSEANLECGHERGGERDCYRSLEGGYALFKADTMPNSEPVYRCWTHHQGPVGAVVVPQPVVAMEITLNQESG